MAAEPTDAEAAAVLQDNLDAPKDASYDAPSPLNLSPEMIAACARQDIPAAHVAEFRAHVALIGERARRLAVEAEYAKYLHAPQG